jgi:monofunctional glycosyltransferase
MIMTENNSLQKRLAAFFRRFWYRDDGKTPWVRRFFVTLFALFVPLPMIYLAVFRFVPVPATPQMLLDMATLQPVQHTWVDYYGISPDLRRSVIGSEDQAFCTHHGFDWEDIDKALRQHDRHPRKRLRGASTISQQVARTLFLLPARSWMRKGMEAYFTVLLETFWPKKRIYTAYLNLVDWGNGNYGAEAAAQSYFGIRAAQLNKVQAARLATILPNPDKWKAAHPGPYVARRSEVVRDRAFEVIRDGLDWCVQ